MRTITNGTQMTKITNESYPPRLAGAIIEARNTSSTSMRLAVELDGGTFDPNKMYMPSAAEAHDLAQRAHENPPYHIFNAVMTVLFGAMGWISVHHIYSTATNAWFWQNPSASAIFTVVLGIAMTIASAYILTEVVRDFFRVGRYAFSRWTEGEAAISYARAWYIGDEYLYFVPDQELGEPNGDIERIAYKDISRLLLGDRKIIVVGDSGTEFTQIDVSAKSEGGDEDLASLLSERVFPTTAI